MFVQRNWLWLLMATPIALYAAWIASVLVPQVVQVFVPEVTRSVLGG